MVQSTEKAKKKRSKPAVSHYACLEEVVGCKWSVSVLMALQAGVQRPGALERAVAGISTKVLNERLRKLKAYGLITRTEYLELPLRTEYALTDKGTRLMVIIGQLQDLDRQSPR